MPLMARQIIVRLALALFGAGLLTAGIVILTKALWMALALRYGPIWASVDVGGTLSLVGLLLFVLAGRRPRVPVPPRRDPVTEMVYAFIEGAAAGRTARRNWR